MSIPTHLPRIWFECRGLPHLLARGATAANVWSPLYVSFCPLTLNVQDVKLEFECILAIVLTNTPRIRLFACDGWSVLGGGLPGLEAGCDHVVCLDCIRTWRKSEDSNDGRFGCPVCRTESRLVIPSAVFATGKQKNEIRAAYMTRLSTIPCKNFNYGNGRCRFAPECLYAHLNSDGSLAVDENGLQSAGKPPPPRKRRVGCGRTGGPNQMATELSERELQALLGVIEETGGALNMDTMLFLRLYMRLGVAPDARLLRMHMEISDDEDDDDDDDDSQGDYRGWRGVHHPEDSGSDELYYGDSSDEST